MASRKRLFNSNFRNGGHHMTRKIIILFSLAVTLTFSACGVQNQNQDNSQTTSSNEVEPCEMLVTEDGVEYTIVNSDQKCGKLILEENGFAEGELTKEMLGKKEAVCKNSKGVEAAAIYEISGKSDTKVKILDDYTVTGYAYVVPEELYHEYLKKTGEN